MEKGMSITESFTWEDTFSLGEKLGKGVESGDVICVNGGLGAG